MQTTAFSNATEYEIWAARWCDKCVLFDDCAILLDVMINNQVPAQWTAKDYLHWYECSAFDRRKAEA